MPVLLLGFSLLSSDWSATANPEQFGRMILSSSLGLVPLLFLLVVAPQCALSIAGERERGTLPLVLAAPVSATGFVLSKFASYGLLMTLLFAATLPPASISFLYGGVDPRLFAGYVAILLAWIAFGTAVGVAVSAFCARSVVAMRVAMSVSLMAPLTHLLLALWLFDGSPSPMLRSNVAYTWFRLLRASTEGLRGPADVVGPTVSVLVAGALVALLVAIRRIASEGRERSTRTERGRRVRPLRFRNPFLARQLEGSVFRGPGLAAWFRFSGYLVLPGLLVWGMLEDHWDADDQEAYYTVSVPLLLFACLTALSGTSASLARERETGSWPLLRATRLSVRDLVEGSALAHMLRGGVPLGISVLILGAAVVHPEADISVLELVVWGIAGLAGMYGAALLGLMASCRASTASKGIGRAAAWGFGAVVGHGLLLGALGLADAPGDLIVFLAFATPPVLFTFWLMGAHAATEALTGNSSWTDVWSEPVVVTGVLVWTVAWAIGLSLFRRHVNRLVHELEPE